MTRAATVWPVGQQTAGVQRRGRYLPGSTAHPGKMLPALAHRAISLYSNPGELVLDPMCGSGTTLVEAVHLGRQAVGVELEQRWVALAEANLRFTREQGVDAHALAVQGDARRLGRGLLDELANTIALIVTSPPYGDSLHGQPLKLPDGIEIYDNRYSHNPANIAELAHCADVDSRSPFDAALAEVFAGCMRMLRPGGRVVLTARPYRRGGELVDLPGRLERLAAEAGFRLERRLAALLCALRDDRLVPRPSFFQLQKQRSGQIPRMLLVAHEDVLVLRKPVGARAQQRPR